MKAVPPDPTSKTATLVSLSYSGVHEIFQLALAAHESGTLDGLFCSMIDRPGKLGGWLARLARIPSATPFGADSLPSSKLFEFPWPVLISRMLLRLIPGRQTDHWRSNRWFDAHSARWLATRKSAVYVGNETCAARTLEVARGRGMATVLDCPGIPASFLDHHACIAAERVGIHPPDTSNRPEMIRMKRQERELADILLACSDFHKRIMVQESYAPADKIRVLPLWVDAAFWAKGADDRHHSKTHKLRILYAGAISLKKGVPYLLNAVAGLADKCDLTLVGKASAEVHPLLASHSGVNVLPYASKIGLRELYGSHDLLVMPTLGDSFGFVVLEAMAAGLPVIASSHCGAPVPDESWRVPAHDSQAIADRLRHYLQTPDALRKDSHMAREFAVQFSPERYRRDAAALFQSLAL